MFLLCFHMEDWNFPCFGYVSMKYNWNSHVFSPCFHTIPVTALGWLGRFAGWMAGLVGCDGWLTGWLAGCVGWLVGWLASWMAGWLAAWLAGPVAPNNWTIRIPIWKLYLIEINYNNLNFHVFCCVFCVPHRDSPNCSKELDNFNSHRMIKFDLKRWDNWKFHFVCVAFILFCGPRDLCHTFSLTLFF